MVSVLGDTTEGAALARRRRRSQRVNPELSLAARLLKRPRRPLSPSRRVEVDDRRRFSVTRGVLSSDLTGNLARVEISVRPGARVPKDRLPYRIGYVDPRHVLTCVRRSERREVMFALGRTGKGSRARVRRSQRDTHIVCRRR